MCRVSTQSPRNQSFCMCLKSEQEMRLTPALDTQASSSVQAPSVKRAGSNGIAQQLAAALQANQELREEVSKLKALAEASGGSFNHQAPSQHLCTANAA